MISRFTDDHVVEGVVSEKTTLPTSVHLFRRNKLTKIKHKGRRPQITTNHCDIFIAKMWKCNPVLNSEDILKHFSKSRINRLWATVSYHGDDLGDFQVRKSLLKRWRDTADNFPDLKVSVFEDYAPFIDQLDTILPATISTSICTLLCMMLVCFLFMYNLFTVVVATFSITSICIDIITILHEIFRILIYGMYFVFVKTMVLVVLLGLIHGLILVPAFLCALSGIYDLLFKKRVGDNQSFSSLAKLFAWKISPSSSEGKISSTPSTQS
uniref:Death domain-containing protein n=1 Tax=Heterorhabditis bacteriophora TaxID=37862 RepID=A0A1I7WSW5_HETBA